MLYIITGESYQCFQQLNKLKKEYYNYEYYNFSFTEQKLAELNNILGFQSLFNNPKLIVIRDWNNENLKKTLKTLKESSDIVVFYNPESKTRQKSTKNIVAINFSMPKDRELIQWIDKELKSRNVSSNEFLKMFQTSRPKLNNLWPIVHEIEKYALLGTTFAWAIEQELDPFALTNAISQKKYASVLFLIESELNKKKEAFSIVARILWQLRVLLVSPVNPSAYHPLVVQKARQAVQNFNEDEIKNLYQKAVVLYEKSIYETAHTKPFLLSQFFWSQLS